MELKEKAKALCERAPKLTEAELRELNGLFPSYIFRRRKTREIWTTCCGVHAELPPGSEILDAAHTAEPKPTPPLLPHGVHVSSRPEAGAGANGLPILREGVAGEGAGTDGQPEEFVVLPPGGGAAVVPGRPVGGVL